MSLNHFTLILGLFANKAACSVIDNVALGWQANMYNGYALPSSNTGTSEFSSGITVFDAFLGPFCEDSKEALPTMKALNEYYATEFPNRLFTKIHIFPLPYNLGSFLPAQACVATGLLTGSNDLVIPCLELIYANQTAIKTFAMENGTVPQVISELARQISDALPVDYDSLNKELAQNLESGGESYELTKSDWKYGCSRGVFATPSFFINQVPIYGVGTHAEGYLAALSVSEWREILDPIVNRTGN